MDRQQSLEEQVAHLQRLTDELSDVLARHETDIARLARRVEILMQREAEREAAEAGTVPMADRNPPHW